ncbi:unnamed protein product [Didymodactylos carnosus]|uniref:Uncharacterized protein n=1 Tax=Didymodactylos carnosus TaxID=1234261 RepID=A0A814RB74_9BILA|nr:unnamed protein product [Didymodactylos carnosus]CAF1131594.1 unnamed protein product [Didymodactylos carnosus]CAF3673886.1 unnamed protein product [Didymodactylos carnosus]CAF3895374.1 unnamed protein product [Didymodactylos carnosus]
MNRSTTHVLKELFAGVLTGGTLGLLWSNGKYLWSYVTLTGVALIDIAHHYGYLTAHITHLSVENYQQQIVNSLGHLHRQVKRSMFNAIDDGRDPNMPFTFLWSDVRRQIDLHLFFGMGLTLSYLTTIAIASTSRRKL